MFFGKKPNDSEPEPLPSSAVIAEQPIAPVETAPIPQPTDSQPIPSQPSEVVTTEPVVTDPNAGTPIKQNYINYSKTALEQVLNDEGQALLFFYADWCPTCRSADKSIQKDHALLPKNFTILKLNYDTETDLKRQYNVTAQHTFVHVNRQGKEISKWLGGGVETILENL